MFKQPETQEIKYVRPLPFGHAQTIAFTQTKSVMNERNKLASTTHHKTVEIISLGQNKYCLTCLDACFIDVYQPDPSERLQLLILEVFDLLVVRTNKDCMIIQINNWAYLQQTWQTLRVEIVQDHDDEKYMKRISDMDVLMQNHENVIAYLSSPVNYGLYFNSYRNLTISEPEQSIIAAYGQELSNITVEENITIQLTETKTQQLVTFQISSAPADEITSYAGSCVYLDGQLDVYTKEIKTASFTINYAAKWVGLKKSFLR